MWLVFLGTRPSGVSALFVVCTDSVLRSASDTQYSEFLGIRDPICIPLSLVGRSKCKNTRTLQGFVHSESCSILCRMRNTQIQVFGGSMFLFEPIKNSESKGEMSQIFAYHLYIKQITEKCT